MLKVMFLGRGGSLQEQGNGNTSLLITGERGSAAVDLSVNLPALTAADVDAVILTHEHIDHVYGLPSLLHQLWIGGRQKPLDIYVPTGMEELAEGLISLFGIRSKANMFEIRISTETEFQVGTISFTLFATDHTKTSVGIVAGEGESKLAYTADTRPIKEIPAAMRGADVLIHEASGLSRDEEILVKKGHSSGEDAGKLAAELNVKKLYLCHLPTGAESQKEVADEARTVFAASKIPEVMKEIVVSRGRNLVF